MKWLSLFKKKAKLPLFEKKRQIDFIQDGICPDCKTGRLLQGPCGGSSMNVACENPECHSEFNICVGTSIFDRLGNLRDESRQKRKKLYGIEQAV
jgi:hypothetical protein